MRRTHLSLRMSRALALEYPVGDPFGGAAYGRREMSLAVVASAASAMAGYAMIGTAVAGSVALGTVIGGALLVGGAMTIVGTLTGNEKLAKWGSTLQLVGNVATFATGAIEAGMKNASFGDAMKAGMDSVSEAYSKGLGLQSTKTGVPIERIGAGASNMGVTGAETVGTAGQGVVVEAGNGITQPVGVFGSDAGAGAGAGVGGMNVAGTNTIGTTPPPTTPTTDWLGSLKQTASDAGTWMEQNKMATYMGLQGVKALASYATAGEQEEAARKAAEEQRSRRGAAPVIVTNEQEKQIAINAGAKYVYMPRPTAPVRTNASQGMLASVPTAPVVSPIAAPVVPTPRVVV